MSNIHVPNLCTSYTNMSGESLLRFAPNKHRTLFNIQSTVLDSKIWIGSVFNLDPDQWFTIDNLLRARQYGINGPIYIYNPSGTATIRYLSNLVEDPLYLDGPPDDNIFTDDFNRADQLLSASADWEDGDSSDSIEIIGNLLETPSANSVRWASHTDVFPTDVGTYAELDLVRIGSTNTFDNVSVTLSVSAQGDDFYSFGRLGSNDNEYILYRWEGGSETILERLEEATPPEGRLRLEREGSTLRGYFNGDLKIEYMDSQLVDTGACGLLIGNAVFNSNESQADNYECGALL